MTYYWKHIIIIKKIINSTVKVWNAFKKNRHTHIRFCTKSRSVWWLNQDHLCLTKSYLINTWEWLLIPPYDKELNDSFLPSRPLAQKTLSLYGMCLSTFNLGPRERVPAQNPGRQRTSQAESAAPFGREREVNFYMVHHAGFPLPRSFNSVTLDKLQIHFPRIYKVPFYKVQRDSELSRVFCLSCFLLRNLGIDVNDYVLINGPQKRL